MICYLKMGLLRLWGAAKIKLRHIENYFFCGDRDGDKEIKYISELQK